MKKLLDILSFLIILTNVIVSLVFYFSTDLIAIPAHWRADGTMDSYGQTWMILLLAGLSVVIYALMVWSEKHHAVNLPFKVKHEPEAIPYIDGMLAWTNFFAMLLLFYVDIAVAQYVPLFQAIVYALILLIIIVGFYYTIRIYRCGRK